MARLRLPGSLFSIPRRRREDLVVTIHVKLGRPDSDYFTITVDNTEVVILQVTPSSHVVALVNGHQPELADEELRKKILQSCYQDLKDTAAEKKLYLRVERLLTILSFIVIIASGVAGAIVIAHADNTSIKLLVGMATGLVSSLVFFLRTTIMRQRKEVSASLAQDYIRIAKLARQEEVREAVQTEPETIFRTIDKFPPQERA